MARRRQSRSLAPREPRSQEALYVARLRHVWSVAQDIIAHGLAPLMAVWPSDEQHADELDPFAPGPRPRTAWDMTDAELRRAWPNFDPREIRDYAPWATSHESVARIATPRPVDPASLNDYLHTAIIRGIEATPPGDVRLLTEHASPPGPGAFRIPRRQPPVIVGPDGIPLPPPPRPLVMSVEAIHRQVGWLDMQLETVITSSNLSTIIDATGAAVDRWNRVELQRVTAIDLRAEIPGMAERINSWRDLNVGLIDSGIRGSDAMTGRRSLLADISETIERAHAEGLRVEDLAGRIRDRFDVSDSRAELIARDQVLKLNAQVNQHRQRAVGVTHYRWRTSRDERVRDSHRVLDGQIISWDAPPQVSEDGRREHAGNDFQCRCVSEPIIPEADEFGALP